jgi:hypothetical protein
MAVISLLKFVHATGHFKSFFRKNVEHRIVTNSRRIAEIRSGIEKINDEINQAGKNSRKRRRR